MAETFASAICYVPYILLHISHSVHFAISARWHLLLLAFWHLCFHIAKTVCECKAETATSVRVLGITVEAIVGGNGFSST